MLYHPETRSLLLKVPDPFAIREVIPKSRTLPHPDYNIAIHHSLEATKILRNMGIEAPTPLQTCYRWPGKYQPFEHQRVMADFLTLHDRCFNLSEPGTAKTNAALWAADFLINEGKVHRVLVLSPLSTLERVWLQDTFDTLMHRRAVVVHGTREKRTAAIKTDSHFYIMNHDGVTIEEITQLLRSRKDIDLVIVDEGSMFRNPSTAKFKALKKLLAPIKRVWWLTGTPTPNAPTDAWSQAQIINPSAVPAFFGQFKRQTMMQVTNFKWAAKPGANDLAFKALQPAIRFKKKDCLDLPPVITVNKQAGITKEQRRAFEEMRDAMQAELTLRDQSKQVLDAVNAADKINKLRQILCGAVKDPETDTYYTIPHGPRFDVLLETIEQASAKVIIVAPFKGIVRALAKELAQHYSVGILNGDISIPARNRIISEFKSGPDPHTLLCHPKVMAHGLNMTEADMMIFYAPIYSNDEYQQVIERMNRPGQIRKMTITRIGASPLEWEIYRMVDTRSLAQDNLLNLYKRVSDGSIS